MLGIVKHPPAAPITFPGDLGHRIPRRFTPALSWSCVMPILFMALISLAIFLLIPVLCTAAVIAEHHSAHKPDPPVSSKA
jgi:hypothetical protein